MRRGYTQLKPLWSSATSRVYHTPTRCMTCAMYPRMRMSFESIRPNLASRSTSKVTLDRPPPIPLHHRPPPIHHHHKHSPIHHHHSLARRRIRSVLPLSSRTRCSTSLLVSRPNGMRHRSTESSSAKMWRPSKLTCA